MTFAGTPTIEELQAHRSCSFLGLNRTAYTTRRHCDALLADWLIWSQALLKIGPNKSAACSEGARRKMVIDSSLESPRSLWLDGAIVSPQTY